MRKLAILLGGCQRCSPPVRQTRRRRLQPAVQRSTNNPALAPDGPRPYRRKQPTSIEIEAETAGAPGFGQSGRPESSPTLLIVRPYRRSTQQVAAARAARRPAARRRR